jgi:hypothetical protein
MTTGKTKAKSSGPIGMVHPLLDKPKRVAFGSLRVAADLFQVRNPKAGSYVQSVIQEQESRGLTASLVKLAEAGAVLDPLIVWQDFEGTSWVIDGHHRIEAMTEACTPAAAKVYVQYFKGETEAEARAFALEVNKRHHLNMSPSETLDSYWRMLLCGEVTGSVRGRAKAHRISISTVQRMDKQKADVLGELKEAAEAEGVELNTAFIRTRAPAWKELAAWRDGEDSKKEDPDRRAIEGILRTLAIRFTDDAKARPYVLIEAFQEFITETTGRTVEVRFATSDDEPDEF